ncbi:MAG: hypothetical protein AB1421_01115 [Pseudomonadota bacterium]
MLTRDLNTLAAPLMAALPSATQSWLSTLLAHPAAQQVFTALENELFIRETPFEGPLLVCSATRGEGRTVLALLLAISAAGLDPSRRVLLVDGDTLHGHLGDVFGVPAAHPGLTEFVASPGISLADAVYPTAQANLAVMTTGSNGLKPRYLAPQAFERLIETARSAYDLIIVDTPAGGQNKGILSMARCVRDILLVVRYGGPTREQVQEFIAEARRAEARILGCVLNQREYVIPNLLYGPR